LEATKPVQQAFGSPGGKSYLAPRIAGIIPPHTTYVEPFAGGAAVFFRKAPSQKEVLSDKDSEIAFAFRFLSNMTPKQFEGLGKYDWRGSEGLFNRLKNAKPKDDVERFRRFYYLRWASYGEGSGTYNHQRDGMVKDISRLQRVHERLKRTRVHSSDAVAMIHKHDSPNTFFYLDPPYPGRAFVGARKEYTTEDLDKLIDALKGIKGKFALSLGTEHAKLLPSNWTVKRVLVRRQLATGNKEDDYQYEIVATNYNPTKQPRVEITPARLSDTKVSLRGQRHTVGGAVRPGVAYTDGKGQRLSRRPHRHWRAVKFA